MATDGEPDYLRRKTENLIERIEDGRALSIMLPAVLLSSSPTTAGTASKKREIDPHPKPSPTEDQGKKSKRGAKSDATVLNATAVPSWAIPTGQSSEGA